MDRPQIYIPLSLGDRLLEGAAGLALVLLWALALASYPYLPQTIPIHFNLYGQADGVGSKLFLWILPVLGTALYAVMGILNKKPHLFNYTTRITPENALLQYTLATRLMRYLKLATLLVFLLIGLFVVLPAMNYTLHLPGWMLPLCLVLIIGPVIVYFFRSTVQ